jgi:hypothetical protein
MEDVEDEAGKEEHTELGMLYEDHKPVWVIDTISKTVIECMDSVPQMLTSLDKQM